MKNCVLFCIVLILQKIAICQNVNVKDYTGTWRWASGRDTLTFIIKSSPKTKYLNLLGPDVAPIFGYHQYIKNGELVESNLHLECDTLSIKASISGSGKSGKMGFIFFDLTRNITLNGVFYLIEGHSDKLWLKLTYGNEAYIDRNEWLRPPPTSMTIPTDIILTRIKKE